MNNRSDLYKQQLLDLAKHPLNYGLKPDADFCSEQINPSCGDSVIICGFVQGSKLTKIFFEGTGCVVSLAMASLLTEHVADMSIDDALVLDEDIVEKLLQIPLGINRLQCGMLSLVCLQRGLRKHRDSL